jgi:hypothetical protein
MFARMRRFVFATLVLIVTPTSAHAGAAFATPPARFDVAPIAVGTASEMMTGFHFIAGLHWASVSPKTDTPIDIGVGYVQDTFYNDEASPQSSAIGKHATLNEPEARRSHGAYLEVALRATGSKYQRSWLGLRGEMTFDPAPDGTRYGRALVGRAAWEICAGGAGGGSGGFGIGTLGLGVFFETGVRKFPGGALGYTASTGLSLRTPFLVVGS